MRRLLGLLGALGALAVPSPGATQNINSEAYLQAKRAVVRLEVNGIGPDGMEGRSVGAGFLISNNGYVLTALHNILYQGTQPYTSRRIVARLNNLSTLPLEPVAVVDTDESLGIAILKLPEGEGVTYQPLVLCMNPTPQPPLTLFAFGFPDAQQFALRQGPFDSPNSADGRWQSGIPVSYGMSGGPVTTHVARVVGIVERGVDGVGDRAMLTPIQWSKQLAGIAYPTEEKCPFE